MWASMNLSAKVPYGIFHSLCTNGVQGGHLVECLKEIKWFSIFVVGISQFLVLYSIFYKIRKLCEYIIP